MKRIPSLCCVLDPVSCSNNEENKTDVQGVSEKDMTAEIGDLAEYVRGKLGDANQTEKGRSK